MLLRWVADEMPAKIPPSEMGHGVPTKSQRDQAISWMISKTISSAGKSRSETCFATSTKTEVVVHRILKFSFLSSFSSIYQGEDGDIGFHKAYIPNCLMFQKNICYFVSRLWGSVLLIQTDVR
ncbi:unnamed protein product [Linum tenue]|uniref:Uncharacterized protein n=1 Tax=Linum tenue TaxID=586396 RepID=A0AAV0NZH5_9ROSI|nr:unnamed protein product [Linum tenue]